MTTTFAAQPQTLPAPPTGTTAPPPSPSPPSGDGKGAVLSVDVEAAFLGKFLGDVLEKAGPPLLDWVRDRIMSMGAAAADEAAVQREVDRTSVAFLGAFTPFIPVLIDIAGRVVQGLTRGQEAGGASSQQAVGSIPTQQQYAR